MQYFDLLPKIKKKPAYARSVIAIPFGTEKEFVRGKAEFPCEMALYSLLKRNGNFVPSVDLSKVDTLWLDFQPNQFGWPMMSMPMAEIVKQHLTGFEGIDWVTARVRSDGADRIYNIPRFSTKLDVLDLEKTDISPSGIYAVAYFSRKKIERYAMFHGRFASWEVTAALVVNEPLMEALSNAKLSGLQFSLAKVV